MVGSITKEVILKPRNEGLCSMDGFGSLGSTPVCLGGLWDSYR